MSRISSPSAWGLMGIPLIVVLSLFGIWLLLSGESAPAAEAIEVRHGNSVIAADSLERALREASELAKFEVVAPANLPGGRKITAITVPPDPPTGTFRMVSLHVSGDGAEGGFTLDVTNSPFAPSPSAEEIPSGVDGARLFRTETEFAVAYSMTTESRGYGLGMIKPYVLPEQEVLEVLTSFPTK